MVFLGYLTRKTSHGHTILFICFSQLNDTKIISQKPLKYYRIMRLKCKALPKRKFFMEKISMIKNVLKESGKSLLVQENNGSWPLPGG